MSEKFTLNRTKQCAKCPWRVSTNPHEIPNGYNVDLHQNLENTIADGSLNFSCLRIMACHESPIGEEDYCVGWLVNQMGAGNNIGLRMQMRNCENFREVKTFGNQHERFEDTLPNE